jgi:hypothetical protein
MEDTLNPEILDSLGYPEFPIELPLSIEDYWDEEE